MPPPMTERNRQRIVLAALARDYPIGITGAIPNGMHSSKWEGAKAKLDGLLVGACDLFIIRPMGKIGWIEMKDDTGKLSSAQITLHARMRLMGHEVYVVRTLEDLWPIIELWKLEDANTPSTPREGS